ncbi:MAG TPA: hypothetical protein VHG93_17145, partial [Longimicrobium sp.]|nr:hypothetical protein [Longimicrobium sp.]
MRRLLFPGRGHVLPRLLGPLAFVLLLLAIPATAHAQCTGAPDEPPECEDGGGTGGDNAPFLSISPASLKTSQPVVPAT